MKFKVGDKVRIREDLEVGKAYNDLEFEKYMQQYKGRTTVITEVWCDCYSLSEDNGEYGWTDEMLEPVEEGEKNNMNIEKLNEEYKNKMDALMEEYKDKIKEVTEEEEPFIKEGQHYFVIDNYFRILTTKNYSCEDDIEKIKIGNCYPFTDETKDEVFKEVSFIAERRKLQSEMEMFARQNNEGKIDWSNYEQAKWFLYIDCGEITISLTYHHRELNVVYFTSEEITKKALEKFGDRIRELYLKEGEEYKEDKE